MTLIRRTLEAVGVGVLIVCGGCAYENVIGVAPGSTRDSLVFVLRGAKPGADPALVYGLGVVRCSDERPMWLISAEGNRLLPDTVRYAQVVPGFILRAGPEPLVADCYKVVASGAASSRFVIDTKGAVARP